MNTGEKVAYQLEKGVSTGKFACYFLLFDFEFYVSVLILEFTYFCCRVFFSLTLHLRRKQPLILEK